MEKRTILKLLVFIIEWHWLFIVKTRRKSSKMPDDGMQLTAPNLLRLNKRLLKQKRDHRLKRVESVTSFYSTWSPADCDYRYRISIHIRIRLDFRFRLLQREGKLDGAITDHSAAG